MIYYVCCWKDNAVEREKKNVKMFKCVIKMYYKYLFYCTVQKNKTYSGLWNVAKPMIDETSNAFTYTNQLRYLRMQSQ
mgnify:CR=1 FL=1